MWDSELVSLVSYSRMLVAFYFRFGDILDPHDDQQVALKLCLLTTACRVFP